MSIFAKIVTGFCLTIFSIQALMGQTTQVQWMTWDQAMNQSKVEKKKVLVEIYTVWCSFCKKLDAVTLKEPDIAEYINENFYPVRLDAQCKTPIEILGKSYKYKDGYNDLARELTFGRLAFPTLVFMDENFRVIQPIPGMRSADELEMIMHFYAKDYYKDTPWDNFVIMFQNRFEKQAPSTRTVKGKN